MEGVGKRGCMISPKGRCVCVEERCTYVVDRATKGMGNDIFICVGLLKFPEQIRKDHAGQNKK